MEITTQIVSRCYFNCRYSLFSYDRSSSCINKHWKKLSGCQYYSVKLLLSMSLRAREIVSLLLHFHKHRGFFLRAAAVAQRLVATTTQKNPLLSTP